MEMNEDTLPRRDQRRGESVDAVSEADRVAAAEGVVAASVVEDATVVSARRMETVNDGTVVVTRGFEPADETVVAVRGPAAPAPEPTEPAPVDPAPLNPAPLNPAPLNPEPVPEGTIVIARRPASSPDGGGDGADDTGDGTIVVLRAGSTGTRETGAAGPRAAAGSAAALPVPETAAPAGAAVGVGAPAPLAPWEAQPSFERGVRPGIPVVYGARSERGEAGRSTIDRVTARLGEAPAATPVAVRSGRQALPSVSRRERRFRVLALAGLGAVIAISVAGLIVVGRLAFG